MTLKLSIAGYQVFSLFLSLSLSLKLRGGRFYFLLSLDH